MLHLASEPRGRAGALLPRGPRTLRWGTPRTVQGTDRHPRTQTERQRLPTELNVTASENALVSAGHARGGGAVSAAVAEWRSARADCAEVLAVVTLPSTDGWDLTSEALTCFDERFSLPSAQLEAKFIICKRSVAERLTICLG